MLFNSLVFLVFFVVVLGVHSSPLSWLVRKWSLLFFSWIFYASWDPFLLPVLGLLTLGNWGFGHCLARTTTGGSRRWVLSAAIGCNLALLGVFKYGNFLAHAFADLTSSTGTGVEFETWDIPLPIGISFLTFEALAYLVDIYRGKSRVSRSLLDFGLFLAFFPHLVAGPIVRPALLLPQFEHPRQATPAQFAWGITLVVFGLFQKVVLADQFLAPAAEVVFNLRPDHAPGFVAAWCGTLAFAGQIFCDFAGYSTCAIGLAKCLGFSLPENFRQPYGALGFSDFWRRWHISLSTWLRDYLYIPLGGNRGGPTRTQINLMATMVLGGLWHGASWTFMAWGALHGFLLILERLLRESRLARLDFWRGRFGSSCLIAATFVGICFTWVCFRATSATDMFKIGGAMIGFGPSGTEVAFGELNMLYSLSIMAAILLAHACMRDRSFEDLVSSTPPWLRRSILVLMIVSLVMSPASDRAFLYFQF